MRRLRNDLAALERLRSESSVFRFTSQGDPPQHYRILFQGRGLWRDRGKVRVLEKHHVEIKLGSSYPRTIPEIRWLTPVYHPNISEIGMVCLGGYGTHWVPSVQLDELCTMLWDMVRYHNYDIRSPYNRDAALWVAQQQTIRFPTDERPLRDLRAALGRVVTDDGGDRAAARRRRPADRPDGAEAPRGRPCGRVRDFVQRYGRVFGAAAEEPGRDGRSPPSGHGAALQLRAARPGGGPGGRVGLGPAAAGRRSRSSSWSPNRRPRPGRDGSRPAGGRARRPSSPGRSEHAAAPPSAEDRRRRRRGPPADAAGRETAGSAGDEIVFIE